MSKQNYIKYYGEEIYLYTILYIFSNPKTGVLVTKVEDLANYLNIPISTLRNYIINLMKWSYIELEILNSKDIKIKLLNFTINKRKELTPSNFSNKKAAK